MRQKHWWLVLGCCAAIGYVECVAAEPSPPADSRLGQLRDLNSYFPFKPVQNSQQWTLRQSEIRRRILVSQGLWPLPMKAPLNAVVHGRVERDDYVVDRVFFESFPGHYVTGSLYRPSTANGPLPAVLSPHGHWKAGRFYDAGDQVVRQEIESGAESSAVGGRYPIQARAVQFARMGCIVFVYDMTGYADSIQLPHASSRLQRPDRPSDWGFTSVQADLRLQNMMGLQTWNSIRAIDFLLELEETDPTRIGVTGASGGGTQSMIVAAIDNRVAAAMPCVMVSTAMQGGCGCENAPYLRIDQGNVDIAAAIAPRPLGLTAADDWTVELQSKGFPDLVRLYRMLDHPDRLTAVFHTQYKHNYNQVNRMAMYSFFNRHFGLGLDQPILERDYQPLSIEEATVWTGQDSKPSGDQVSESHEIQLLGKMNAGSQRQLEQAIPASPNQLDQYRKIVGGAWETMIGRKLDDVGEVRFSELAQRALDRVRLQSGRIDHVDRQEQLPVLQIEPAAESLGTVIWVTDKGKAAILTNDHLSGPARSLVQQGFTLVTADLFGQGDFLPDGQPLTSQRVRSSADTNFWQKFSGYTYGYNHSLFALRTHDLLTLIKYAKTRHPKIHLIGLGRVAGPLVAAASSQASGAISSVIVDARGFRFASVDRRDDPMFVPGSVKYLDLDGLLSLTAPARLTVFGNLESEIVDRVYQASGAANRLEFVSAAASESDLIRRLSDL